MKISRESARVGVSEAQARNMGSNVKCCRAHMLLLLARREKTKDMHENEKTNARIFFYVIVTTAIILPPMPICSA